MNRIEFDAPLPPRGCAQNFRGHWSQRAFATQFYRTELWARALAALGSDRPRPKAVTLSCTFVTGGKRRPDLPKHLRPYSPEDVTNAVGAFKAGEDGIADALGVDDKAATWRHGTMMVLKAEPALAPGVHVTVELHGLGGPQEGE